MLGTTTVTVYPLGPPFRVRPVAFLIRTKGAVMSLRILAQGIAAPVYGEVLSFGLSDAVKRALGTLVPGLPLFLSATFSLAGFMVRGIIRVCRVVCCWSVSVHSKQSGLLSLFFMKIKGCATTMIFIRGTALRREVHG